MEGVDGYGFEGNEIPKSNSAVRRACRVRIPELTHSDGEDGGLTHRRRIPVRRGMQPMPRLRVATARDADRIAAIYRPYVENATTSFELTPPSPDEMERRMRDGLKRFPWLVYSREGTLEGYAYGSPFRSRPAYRWSVEASVYLTEDATGRGVGAALGTALDTILQDQGFVNVFGVVTLPNPASVGLMESLGMEKAGVWEAVGYKRGSWHDVGVWQRQINEPSDNPPTPIPFDDLKRNVIDRALSRGEARLGA